jgi:fatty-acyl-CoA synthase
MHPLETDSGIPHRAADFDMLTAALDYAARGRTGLSFYDVRGNLAGTLSYAELRERAVAAARGLARELPHGARLLLIADTTPQVVTLFMACQYAGVVPVPVALPVGLGAKDSYLETLRLQLERCGAVAAAATAELVGFLHDAASGSAVQVDLAEAFLDLPAGADPRPFGADDLCYLQYSSGSTRFPKGVRVTQRSLSANARGIREGMTWREGDRAVSWLPLYHDMGLVGFFVAPLYSQVGIDLMSTRDFARRPRTWLQVISRNRGTLSYSPSFGYDLSVRGTPAEIVAELDLSCWRVAGIGGDMIQPSVLERFAETFASAGFDRRAFLPSYGMAEATLALTFAPIDTGIEVDVLDRAALADDGIARPSTAGAEERARAAFVRCGRVLAGHDLEIRDEAGHVLPDGRVGQVFARGPSIADGYEAEPETTAETFRDGWLDTGDLGYVTDGQVVITGRAKDLIIVNGRNVWPHDLEWAIERLPGQRRGDAGAFQVEDGDGAQRVVVLLQCRRTEAEARDELVRSAQKLAQHTAAVDATIVLIPPHGLPQTSSGKVSRAKAKTLYLAGHYDTTADAQPRAARAG